MSISQGRAGTLLGQSEALRVEGLATSSSLFHLLGAKALYGRLLRPEEDSPGQPPVVVLSHSFWTRTFGADPAVIGRTIQLNGFGAGAGDAKNEFQIVGVASPDFLMNDEIMPTVSSIRQMDVFVPLPFGADAVKRRGGKFPAGGASRSQEIRWHRRMTTWRPSRGGSGQGQARSRSDRHVQLVESSAACGARARAARIGGARAQIACAASRPSCWRAAAGRRKSPCAPRSARDGRGWRRNCSPRASCSACSAAWPGSASPSSRCVSSAPSTPGTFRVSTRSGSTGPCSRSRSACRSSPACCSAWRRPYARRASISTRRSRPADATRRARAASAARGGAPPAGRREWRFR